MSNSVRVTIEFLEKGEVVDIRGLSTAYHNASADFFADIVRETIDKFNPWRNK